MTHALTALRWLTALCFTVAFSSCMKDSITKTYTVYTPVYKERAEVLANIKSNTPQPIEQKGKIFLYGNYIFLNELNKGVHVINNSNPAAPVREAFIDIPGNVDIAVKGSTLYADLYTDLLAIDISNPLQASLKKVVRHMFPERQYGINFQSDTSKVIVNWIARDTTVNVDEPVDQLFAGRWFTDATINRAGAPVTGIAGSMSRFSVVNDYLYAVNISTLNVLHVANAEDPTKVATAPVGWNIETIYPFRDKLFIGSSGGMFIFSIADPAAPVRQGQFTHARACDPVVADDNYAYVTLRAGSLCTGLNNQLDVVDVRNVMSPSLVKTYPMTNPHGLAKDGNLLFICDGKDGLKVFDASNVLNIRQVEHIKNIDTYDAIAWNNRLIVVASDGIYQYSYNTGSDLNLLSKISINQ